MYDISDKCRVCGGDMQPFLNLKSYNYSSANFDNIFPNIDILKCNTCQLIQTNIADTQLNEATLYEYYSKSYRVEDEIIDLSATDTLLYKRGAGIANIIKKHLSRKMTQSDNPLIVFEKGAGYGFNLMMMKKEFPKAEIFTDEMSEATFRYHSKIGIINQTPEKADVVILSHVLEHFLNPLKELIKLNEMLNENGLLYIEVPNSMRLSEPHICCFTPNSLYKLYSDFLTERYELLDLRTTGFPRYAINDSLTELLRLKMLNIFKKHVDIHAATNWKIKNGVYLRMLLRKKQ